MESVREREVESKKNCEMAQSNEDKMWEHAMADTNQLKAKKGPNVIKAPECQ